MVDGIVSDLDRIGVRGGSKEELLGLGKFEMNGRKSFHNLLHRQRGQHTFGCEIPFDPGREGGRKKGQTLKPFLPRTDGGEGGEKSTQLVNLPFFSFLHTLRLFHTFGEIRDEVRHHGMVAKRRRKERGRRLKESAELLQEGGGRLRHSGHLLFLRHPVPLRFVRGNPTTRLGHPSHQRE